MATDVRTVGSASVPIHDRDHDARLFRFADGRYLSVFIGNDLDAPDKEIAMLSTFSDRATGEPQCSSSTLSHRSPEIDLNVTCIDRLTGNLLAGGYSAIVVGAGSLPSTLAFAFADQPTAASYTPDPARSYTTGKTAMFFERIGVGDWYVHLGTGSPQGTTYLVNAADAGSLCMIGEWKNFGIRVKCFDRGGAPTDVQYKVLQVSRGRPGMPFGTVWADQRSTGVYNPTTSFFESGAGVGTVKVTRIVEGTYRVEFTGPIPPGGTVTPANALFPENVQVTPFGLVYATCLIYQGTQFPAGDQWTHAIDLHCNDPLNRPIDTRFTATLIR